MRNGFLGSMTALLAGAGLALAQSSSVAPRPGAALPTAVLAAQQPTTPMTSMPMGQAGMPAPTTMGSGTRTMTPTPMGMPVAADCGGPGCCLDEPLCGSTGRAYAEVDYLYWWTKGHRLPALVTTGTAGTLLTTATLGRTDTVILFGNKEVDDDGRSGGRFTAGWWVNAERTVGLEATLLILDPASTDFNTSSTDASRVLARPFINRDLITGGLQPNLNVAIENSLPVSLPGLFGGSATASTRNEFWGAELNGRINLGGNSSWRADLLVGFRYLNVEDNLNVTSVSNTLAGVPISSLAILANGTRTTAFAAPVGAGQPTLTIVDSFLTRNEYFAGQLGTNIEVHRGRLFATFTGKIALGVMRQNVAINGSTALNTADGRAPIVATGGLLAQSTNIGNRTNDEFGIVPEAGVNVGYQVNDHLRVHIGYTIVYFRSDVVRPGTQIDRTINPTLVPALSNGLNGTEGRPQFGFRDVDFWAQGLNAGIQISF